jgi:bacteriocin-like protein
MKKNSLEIFGFMPLNDQELNEIIGGHDGTAYQVGKAAGEVVKFVSTCAFIVVAFFMPKS